MVGRQWQHQRNQRRHETPQGQASRQGGDQQSHPPRGVRGPIVHAARSQDRPAPPPAPGGGAASWQPAAQPGRHGGVAVVPEKATREAVCRDAASRAGGGAVRGTPKGIRRQPGGGSGTGGQGPEGGGGAVGEGAGGEGAEGSHGEAPSGIARLAPRRTRDRRGRGRDHRPAICRRTARSATIRRGRGHGDRVQLGRRPVRDGEGAGGAQHHDGPEEVCVGRCGGWRRDAGRCRVGQDDGIAGGGD
mmetsp:Transcript_27018/g.77952  ORF Transcript_27018/g.77952 Transcript_27018/m.77952 type:complete len:246 (-) Transcript_27018:144-881(-)